MSATTEAAQVNAIDLTLRAVAREGSFTAAARKLGRVQAAVSQAIDRLEQAGLQQGADQPGIERGVGRGVACQVAPDADLPDQLVGGRGGHAGEPLGDLGIADAIEAAGRIRAVVEAHRAPPQ